MGPRFKLTKGTGRNVFSAMVGLNGSLDVLPVAPQRHQVPSLLGRVILRLEVVDVLRSVVVEAPLVVTNKKPSAAASIIQKGACWA